MCLPVAMPSLLLQDNISKITPNLRITGFLSILHYPHQNRRMLYFENLSPLLPNF